MLLGSNSSIFPIHSDPPYINCFLSRPLSLETWKLVILYLGADFGIHHIRDGFTQDFCPLIKKFLAFSLTFLLLKIQCAVKVQVRPSATGYMVVNSRFEKKVLEEV